MRCLCALTIALACGAKSEHVEIAAQSSSEVNNQLRDELLHSRTPRELRSRVQKLVKDHGGRSIEVLKHDESAVVGIHAAWNEAVRALKVSGTSIGDGALALNSRDALSRFCGFTEARLHVDLPTKWRGSIANVNIKNGVALVKTPDSHLRESKLSFGTLSSTDDVRIYEIGDQLNVTKGKESVTLGKEMVRTQLLARPDDDSLDENGCLPLPGGTNWIVNFDKDYCYVAMILDYVRSFTIFAIRRSDGGLAWRSLVWGLDGVVGRTGSSGYTDNVSIVVSGGDVVVAGVEAGSAFIEVFDATKKGRVKLRFCTLYWYERFE